MFLTIAPKQDGRPGHNVITLANMHGSIISQWVDTSNSVFSWAAGQGYILGGSRQSNGVTMYAVTQAGR